MFVFSYFAFFLFLSFARKQTFPPLFSVSFGFLFVVATMPLFILLQEVPWLCFYLWFFVFPFFLSFSPPIFSSYNLSLFLSLTPPPLSLPRSFCVQAQWGALALTIAVAVGAVSYSFYVHLVAVGRQLRAAFVTRREQWYVLQTIGSISCSVCKSLSTVTRF